MAKYASEVVKQAQEWVGLKESDGSHMLIVNIYNSQEKLPRSYPLKSKDSWCAAFVSSVAIKLGYTDIIPTECSCPKMIELFKGIGCWVEDESSITPAPGTILFYDWEDDGRGDNKGQANHVGIVEKVADGKITVIEGNYSDSIKRRTLNVNGKYIRGYGVPKYDTEKKTETKTETAKVTVLDFQKAAIADGFKFPKAGADGIWGSETEGVTKKAVVKKRLTYKYKNCTKLVQKVCGVEVDGYCGKDTDKAIRTWQRMHGLEEDGAFGPACWKKLLT